jgi:putative ABC transport system permease protein
MSRMQGIVARLRSVLARRDAERRMQEEFGFHLEMETERLVRSGVPMAEARRRAFVAFGGVERHKEDMRDERGARWAEDLAQDVRYAARVLRRAPALTIATVLTFALGIGAATAIFSVVYGVLLRPLPYRDPARLAVLWERNLARGSLDNVVSVPNFEAWRDRSRSFSGMAALVPSSLTLAGDGAPERVAGAEVSPGYFRLLGVAPAIGREFTEREAVAGDASVVVLSDALWRRRFGADPAIVGRAFATEGRTLTIVGVMPSAFDPPRFGWLGEQQYWLPFVATSDNRGWGRFLLVVARLRDGVTVEQARGEMTAIADRLAREVKGDAGWSVAVVELAREITGDVRTSLLAVLGAVGLLLLMAITNVATLTLTATRRRWHELAVRRAIGATRARLARQLLTQGTLLGAIGTTVGIAVAIAGVPLLVALLPGDVPRAASIRVDGAVLFACACVSVLATLAFAIVSALGGMQGADASGASADRAGPSSLAAHGRVSPRSSGSLVIAEVALGVVLAVLAGLTMRSLIALRAVDLGFASEHVVAARLALPGGSYDTPERQQRFFDALVARVRALPGVRAVSTVSTRPLGGIGPATGASDPAHPIVAPAEPPVVDVRYVDAAYFRTLRIPVVAGAAFDERERADGPPRVVISRSLARELWPGEPLARAIGRHIALAMFGGITPEVVGIVGDVHLIDPRTAPRGTAYLSLDRFPSETRDLIVRADAGAEGDASRGSLVASLRAAVAALDAGLPVYRIETLDGLVETSLARDRFTAFLLGAFALVALLLAAVGIFGVCTADVTRRRAEIGIRLALGARPADVMLLILRDALTRAAVGVTIGIAAALGVTRAIEPLLFGVRPADPASFVTVTAVLIGVATAATLIPAIRASRTPPMGVIRGRG